MIVSFQTTHNKTFNYIISLTSHYYADIYPRRDRHGKSI